MTLLGKALHAKETGKSSGRLGLCLECAFTFFFKAKRKEF